MNEKYQINTIHDRLTVGAASVLGHPMEDKPAAVAFLSELHAALSGIAEAEERLRFTADRIEGPIPTGPETPKDTGLRSESFLADLQSAVIRARELRSDLHQQIDRLNRAF